MDKLAETLLLPLCIRAVESQRPDALGRDECAVALVQQMGVDCARVLAKIAEETRVAMILRSREFDRHARDFLTRHPEAVVVHIGCGLDARFERVAERNSQVEWYDLDLPQVIDLRQKYIGGEEARYHLLACSVLDDAWLDVVDVHRPRPFLFMAEGVFMYLTEDQVRALVCKWMERFPDAELVFDAFSPFFVWANNRRVARTKVGALCRWGLKRGTDLERWAGGICLLDEWFPFTQPEPRLASVRWVRYIPLLAKTTGVFRYWLGQAATGVIR